MSPQAEPPEERNIPAPDEHARSIEHPVRRRGLNPGVQGKGARVPQIDDEIACVPRRERHELRGTEAALRELVGQLRIRERIRCLRTRRHDEEACKLNDEDGASGDQVWGPKGLGELSPRGPRLAFHPSWSPPGSCAGGHRRSAQSEKTRFGKACEIEQRREGVSHLGGDDVAIRLVESRRSDRRRDAGLRGQAARHRLSFLPRHHADLRLRARLYWRHRDEARRSQNPAAESQCATVAQVSD
jgi:hypothetical protein